MIGQHLAKWGFVTSPAAIVDNASLTTKVIDTLGFDRCEIIVLIGALDIAMTALKVQESDVAASATALTSGADITETIGGAAFTLPTATDDDKILIFDLNLVNQVRKRYLDVVATCGDGAAGTYIAIAYRLSKGHVDPVSTTDANVLAKVIV